MHDSAMSSAIKATVECSTTCSETVTHCLTKGGEHARPEHVKLLIDCAEICQTAGGFMARGVSQSTEIVQMEQWLCEWYDRCRGQAA